jgi:phage tail P2-like protein
MGNILATSISGIPHLAAFDELAKQQFEGIDLTKLMMYLVDTAPSEALIHLAEQFNVLGWKGWNISQSEEDRRALIKKAIELNRYKGTVWAIKEACRAVGFDDAEVREGVGINFDGSWNFDGNTMFSGGAWYNFRVIINLPDGIEINATNHELVRQLVLTYKNARSILIDISYRIIFVDVIDLSDEFLEFTDEGIVDTIAEGFYFNGLHAFDGSQLFEKAADIINLTVWKNGVIIEQDEF